MVSKEKQERIVLKEGKYAQMRIKRDKSIKKGSGSNAIAGY